MILKLYLNSRSVLKVRKSMRKLTTPMYIYFISHFFYGQYFNVLGALIPYLTEETGRSQEQWTYVITLRGIGYLIGGFLQRSEYVHDKDIHRKMFYACLISGLGFIMFSQTTNIYFLCIIMFFASIASCSLQILINVLLLIEGREDPKFYVNLSYCFYGLGSALGPALIAWLGLSGPLLIGTFQVLTSFGFLLVPSPQRKKQTSEQKVDLKPLNQFQQYCLAIMVMFYAAMTLSIRNWYPTFTVLEKIGTKEKGALSISLYSTSITIFRFLALTVTMETSRFLQILSNSIIITFIGAFICFLVGLKQFMIFGSAFFLGALFSPYYPFLFAVPKVHGKMVSSKNSATMMIFYAFGEGILVSVVGYMIILIHPLMLFICCLAMMTTNKILLMKIIESLKTFSEIENKLVETEMNELENKDKDRI